MSQVRSGEQQVYTTTSTYTPAQTGYYATGEAVQRQTVQPGTSTYEYASVPQYAVQGSEYRREGEVVRQGEVRREGGSRAVAADIPVESRIEYIPFEKKYVEYEQVEKVYQVPVEYEEVEYEEVVRNERVPYEKTITDYYAVETQVEYIKREVEETVMVEEPVERVYERVQYIPVETQIVHYPERDNYVAAPTKTRTEYLGIVEGGYKGEVTEANTNNYYAAPVENRVVENRVETRVENRPVYESRPVETRVESRAYESRPVEYKAGQTTYVSGGSGAGQTTYVSQSGYAPNANTTYYQQPASSTYQTGYVTGGSGVRQTGYVTGGSGVRGSNVKY